ncbi:phenylalanine--tRNA ligase chloroplastic/mitochondrial, partial [Fagus crenata]
MQFGRDLEAHKPFWSSVFTLLCQNGLQRYKRFILIINLSSFFVNVVVRDDPTNNVPDTIFSKLGMQLHRRDQHPIGILKNAIHEYFDT